MARVDVWLKFSNSNYPCQLCLVPSIQHPKTGQRHRCHFVDEEDNRQQSFEGEDTNLQLLVKGSQPVAPCGVCAVLGDVFVRVDDFFVLFDNGSSLRSRVLRTEGVVLANVVGTLGRALV